MHLVERIAQPCERIGVLGHRSALRYAGYDDFRAAPHGIDQTRFVGLLLDPGAARLAVVLGEELELVGTDPTVTGLLSLYS